MAPTGGMLMPLSHDPFALDNNNYNHFGHFSEEDIERFVNEMTAFELDDENNVLLSWTDHQNFNGTSLSSPSSTEVHVPRSPLSRNQPASASGNSLSPNDAPLIYTPTSTVLDFPNAGGFDGSDSDMLSSTSPMSSFSLADEYVHVDRHQSASSTHRHGTMAEQPQQTQHSVPTSHPIPISRPQVSLTYQQQPYSQPNHHQQWQSCSFSSSNSNGADHQQGHSFSSTTTSAGMLFHDSTADRYLSNIGAFNHPYPMSGYQNHTLPFRQFDDASFLPSPYGHHVSLPQETSFRTRAHHALDSTGIGYRTVATPSVTAAALDGQRQPAMSSPNFAYNQFVQETAQANIMHDPHTSTNERLQMPTTSGQVKQQKVQQSAEVKTESGTSPSSSQVRGKAQPEGKEVSSAAMIALRGRRQSHVTRPAAASSSTRVESTGVVRNRKGGRVKGNHLPEQTRAKTTVMRKVGACWRCALQRDPCDHKEVCNRCDMRSQRGQTYFFGCDRSKLPHFVHDFLPPSMTYMHQKQSIEDTVSSEVLDWSRSNPISIQLSSGYGPPLQWLVYEFSPRSPELLSQLQYYTQDHRMAPTFKYSPPYGLLKLDTSDDAHMENYLDELLEPKHLPDFAWCCYEEECVTDPEAFQAGALDLMCKLYLSTSDEVLKPLLRTILRLQLVTFIMGHTLTLTSSSLPATLENLIKTPHPPLSSLSDHTSPRLANRQLKFFLSVLRHNLSTHLLKWLQSTLHTASRKHLTFLPSFLVMLGFAMSLEEVQRTIIIQADAKVRRGNGMVDAKEVEQEARNACERIDERWNLLVGLFQCKYRDKKWDSSGDFGSGTPRVEGKGGEFLRELRELVVERETHLRSRSEVSFSVDNQCLYTTRLTARFLLPFLKLPKT